MIIIKILRSILYFIQIRHTDDLPSTGTRLVEYNMSLQISNIHQIIIICSKIQLRKKLFHSDFVGVDLRNKILF